MLPNYLANIKSSGIYRFVWDKSEVPGAPAEILRLVVGHSEKGPFNTPVYVKSEIEFKQIFGGKSKKMERYGVWFNRLAIQALKEGPILALNIKNFENPYKAGTPQYQEWENAGYNKVDYTTFNPDASILNEIDGEIMPNLAMTVKQLYNTDRFWKLEPEHLEDLEIDGVLPASKKPGYITITTTDSKDTSVSIFMRGYEPTGYDVPFKEWYSSVLNGEDLPSYLEGHENDLVSQYFAQLYIFKGQFTPEVASSDKLSKFFDVNGTEVRLKPYITNAFGEKVDTLDALANNDASNFVKAYTGILLPDFRNANNTVISLDALVNGDNYTHKLMMRFNQAMLWDNDPDEYDLIAHIDTTGWNKGPEIPAHTRIMSLDGVDPIVYKAIWKNYEWKYQTTDPHEGLAADYYQYEDMSPQQRDPYSVVYADDDNRFGFSGVREGDSIFIKTGTAEGYLTHIVKITQTPGTTYTAYDVTVDGKPIDKYLRNSPNIGHVEGSPEHWTIEVGGTQIGGDYSTLQEAQSAITYHPATEYWTIGSDQTPYSTEPQVIQSQDDTWGIFVGGTQIGGDYSTLQEAQSAITYHQTTEYWTIDGDETHYTTQPDVVHHEVVTEHWTIGEDTTPYFTQPEIVQYEWTPTIYTVQMDKPVDVNTARGRFKCVGSITATSANLVPLYLKGYVFGNPKPESTRQDAKLDWQHYILNALVNYRGLRLALTNRKDVDYRYLVDTFESFVESECKSMLSNIVMTKDNTLGLMNFPRMSSFSKCSYTSFRNEKSEFLTKYIPMGGNPQKPMARAFSLPSQENGASWVGFFSALALRDGDTGVREEIPSAALVSNLYMQKYTKYLPYTIIAGPNRAVVRETGLIGPDFNFGSEDMDELEPFGVNCMVYDPRKGTFINSNQTAKQNPVTALSKINVRELCIYLQDEIEKLMTDYHWDFNTPNLQQRIKDRADTLLERAKKNDGVYDYLNVCDSSNNTVDVIDNEMFVLSTSIEPTKGAGKMVQELTIYRKGGMSAMVTEA